MLEPFSSPVRLHAMIFSTQQCPAVLRNVPPPTLHFNRPLHWWSLDRRKRLATVMRLWDHLLEDILHIGGTPR
ncbi:MAG: hypothetical protein Nkreftii_003460 [Candidatus Nitrospira kreftii]|uniref:Uncharacterized protein n=1 Tax=Candidatus Nitrospira kreftii TaxID=2652173 RepID=A0A7S8J0W2_9BACT|nr:MAG: hypothetical protein Nkreftii_003460 [Candidatus Nitrospira kreftii]